MRRWASDWKGTSVVEVPAQPPAPARAQVGLARRLGREVEVLLVVGAELLLQVEVALATIAGLVGGLAEKVVAQLVTEAGQTGAQAVEARRGICAGGHAAGRRRGL